MAESMVSFLPPPYVLKPRDTRANTLYETCHLCSTAAGRHEITAHGAVGSGTNTQWVSGTDVIG